MPPTDASAGAGSAPVHPRHPGHPGPAEDIRDCEDTLDLRLPDELLALFAGKTPDTGADGPPGPDSCDGPIGRDSGGGTTASDRCGGGPLGPSAPDGTRVASTIEAEASELGVPAAFTNERESSPLGRERATALTHDRATALSRERATALGHDRQGPLDAQAPFDLLDQVGTWGPIPTPVGPFHLVPARVDLDLPLISGWMNDPAVAEFWQLAVSRAQTEEYLRAQLAGDGRSVPCLGMLDGTPMSYWEIYRADLDPLARHYPSRPHDTGVHLLIGDPADRRRGLGSALLRAVADLVLDHRPACARVVAEPDLRNTPSVAAFLGAGFRYAAELDLPAKRAALMIRDRSLRHLM